MHSLEKSSILYKQMTDVFNNLWNSQPYNPTLIFFWSFFFLSYLPLIVVFLIKEWYLLAHSGEGEAYKGTGQIFCVHLISHSFKVILLPCVLLNLIKSETGKCCTLVKKKIYIYTFKRKLVSKKKQFFFQKMSNLVSRCPTAQHQPGHYKLIHHLYGMRTGLW